MRFVIHSLLLIFSAFFVFAAAASGQSLPWTDDFSDGDMAGWTIIDDVPAAEGPSQWSAEDGVLRQVSNIYTTANEYGVFTGTHIFTGNSAWTDYTLLARLESGDDDGIGVLFRYQDKDNYYRLIVLQDPGNRGPFKRLEKRVNGAFTTLAEDATGGLVPGFFDLKMRVAGDSIRVYIDDELLFSVADNAFGSGKVGFMCYANSGAGFDDVVVSEQDTSYSDDILVAPNTVRLKAASYNLYGGNLASAADIGAFLANLDLDVLGLEECTPDYARIIANQTGMHYDQWGGAALLSKTPLTQVRHISILGRSIVGGRTVIGDNTISLYAVHISWDEAGDRQARYMVDNVLTRDPVPKQVLMGDFNDEHYSTQNTILEEHLRDCWTDLGVSPSDRVTWPAFDWYGGEGAQIIDFVWVNKASRGRAVDGDILNQSPILSDHKPIWAIVQFPADPDTVRPWVTGISPWFGDSMVEVEFDTDLDAKTAEDAAHYQIIPSGGGAGVSVLNARLDEHKRRVRLTTSAHDYNLRYSLAISQVMDEFAVEVAPGTSIDYVVRENLVQNPSGENGTAGWETAGGFTAEASRENQHPYLGSRFFTGAPDQALSTGTQVVDLSSHAVEIDAGMSQAVWNCYFATGYEALGDIQASRCEPYDEGEMMVEFLSANGDVLLTGSSHRRDTLHWHRAGEQTCIPPGTRSARVGLRSYRKTENGLSNDACFENAFFAYARLQHPHPFGANLLANPSAELGELGPWIGEGGLDVRPNTVLKARSASGDHLFVGRAVSASPQAYQEIDLNAYQDVISRDFMSVRWGGFMRDFAGKSACELALEFLDESGQIYSEVATGMEKVAEWNAYDEITPVPDKARSVRFWMRSQLSGSEEVFFDFVHLIPVVERTSEVEEPAQAPPTGFRLDQSYPNPLRLVGPGNGQTSISFYLVGPSRAALSIYDLLGARVRELDMGKLPGGEHSVSWDGRDDAGRPVAPGVYFYKLNLGAGRSVARRMMVVR